MNPHLNLFYRGKPTKHLRALQSISEFWGIPSILLELDGASDSETRESGKTASVIDVATVMGDNECAPSQEILQRLVYGSDPLLFLVTEDSEPVRQRLRELSGEIIRSVNRVADVRSVQFAVDATDHAKELAGSRFARPPSEALNFSVSEDAPKKSIMITGKEPSFLSWNVGASKRFAWATPSVLDITVLLQRELDFELSIDRCIPFFIFLRTSFGESCWHNPERTAAFLIDDPLLVPQYGFINFPELLSSARQHRYKVSVAFIPWNAWRTHLKNAVLFRSHSDVFSLCVHGCDHTDNEYGSDNLELLRDKNKIALQRMERHAARTGIPFSRLVVCPQEQCSIEAWKAFSETPNLQAMFNTGCLPRNVGNRQVRVQDLLLPAQDAYFGFPVFKRHYSSDFSAFQLGLFLGKPAILVEHHDFFRDGLKGIEEFVRRSYLTCPGIQWPSINEIAEKTHLCKRESNSSIAIRFFTRQFRIDATTPCVLRMRKRIHDPHAIRKVLVNGQVTPFAFESDFLTFEIVPSVRRSYEVMIDTVPVLRKKTYSLGIRYQSGVAVRRVLSELRDNVLSRHQTIAALSGKTVRALRLATDKSAPVLSSYSPPSGTSLQLGSQSELET